LSTHITDLKDGARRVEVSGEITKMAPPRTVILKNGDAARVCDATLRDGSGAIKLSLWNDDIERCKEGSRVRIENGYINSYRGELSLNTGKFGSLHFL